MFAQNRYVVGARFLVAAAGQTTPTWNYNSEVPDQTVVAVTASQAEAQFTATNKLLDQVAAGTCHVGSMAAPALTFRG